MSANNWLAQDIANMLDIRCERPADVETTARGAAILAAIGLGHYPDLAHARGMIALRDVFEPDMVETVREGRLDRWRSAVGRHL